jgi:hypothetical protein
MSRRFSKLLALFIAIIALVILTVWWTMPRPTKPRLSVTYIATINGNGHWRLKFGVTNIGNRTIVTYKLGSIEVTGHSNKFQVGATAPLVRLAPGQGHVIEAVLSEKKWHLSMGPGVTRVSTLTITFARALIGANSALSCTGIFHDHGKASRFRLQARAIGSRTQNDRQNRGSLESVAVKQNRLSP